MVDKWLMRNHSSRGGRGRQKRRLCCLALGFARSFRPCPHPRADRRRPRLPNLSYQQGQARRRAARRRRQVNASHGHRQRVGHREGLGVIKKAESFSRFDAADYLHSPEDIRAYLEAAAEDGDPSVVAAALGAVARAQNMSKLARDIGMTREGLYKALSPGGNPSFGTVSKVAQALGLEILFRPSRKQPNAGGDAAATTKAAARRLRQRVE